MPGHGAPPRGAAGLRLPLRMDPELAVPHSWFLSFRVNSQVLWLQHPDFQRTYPTTKEPGTLQGDIGLSAKQERKRKKKRHASSLHPPRGAKSQDMLGEQSWWLQPHKLGWAGMVCALTGLSQE